MPHEQLRLTRPVRRLALRREQLAPLSRAALGAVAGGAPPTLPVDECTSVIDVPNTRFGSGACAHTAFDCLTRMCE